MKHLLSHRALEIAASGAALGWPAVQLAQGQDFSPRLDLDELYDADVDRAIREGLAFLLSRQNQDGTFSRPNRDGGLESVHWLAWHCSVAVCVRELAKPVLGLQRTGRYVLSQVQASGFLSATGETSHGPMYDHGFGTLFLAELYGTDRDTTIRQTLVGR